MSLPTSAPLGLPGNVGMWHLDVIRSIGVRFRERDMSKGISEGMKEDRGGRRPVFSILTALLLLTCTVCLGFLYFGDLGQPLNNSDEAIYASMIQEMHHTGDYLTIRYQGAALMQRPPTAVTLYALTSLLVPGELGMRLMPAFLTLLTALLVGASCWRLTGRVSAAVGSGLLLALTPSVLEFGRLILTDPPFVLACLGALLATVAAQERGRFIPWAAAGLGVAVSVKSLAAAVPGLALFPWLIRALWRCDQGRTRTLLVSLAVFLLFAAPFYVLSYLQYGQRFIDEHVGRILIDRAAGRLESFIGMEGGVVAYAEHLWTFDGPGLAILFSVVTIAGLVVAAMKRDRRLAVAATYSAVTFLTLSLLGTRLPHYLLVTFPGIALTFGMLTARLLPRRVSVELGVVGVLLTGALALVPQLSTRDALRSPSPGAERLGAAVQDLAPQDERIYTFNLYLPALGFYADRHWHLLTDRVELGRGLQITAPFLTVGNIHITPPWPSEAFTVVGLATELSAVEGLQIDEILYVLDDSPADPVVDSIVIARARAFSAETGNIRSR